MPRIQFWMSICLFACVPSLSIRAQSNDRQQPGRDVSLNRMITFTGTLRNFDKQVQPGSVRITFSLYASQEGGDALWRESQDVQVNERGWYSVLLGATEAEGLPLQVFRNGQARWLGVQAQDGDEEPRVLLVTVPYALKAADADTVGGRPLSSFVLYEDIAKMEGRDAFHTEGTEHGTLVVPKFAVNSSSANGAPRESGEGGRILAKNESAEPVYGNEVGTNTYYGEGAANGSMTGGANSIFGYYAGHANTTGSNNAFFGYFAGASNSLGYANTFVGRGAGYSNLAGTDNSFFGSQAGYYSTENFNSFFGSNSGYRNTTGGNNSFFGNASGYWNTAGSYNCFFGDTAGYANTTGNNNSFFGESAGQSNTTGRSNSFFGYAAGSLNATGSYNAIFGDSAGTLNTTGINNSFFGASAGYNNTTGTGNNFFGWRSGYSNTTGGANSFFGFNAGQGNITGGANAFFGNAAGLGNTTGWYNTASGDLAGKGNTEGNYNAFVGYQAGGSNTVENGNTFVGALSDGMAGILNATAIGYQAVVAQSNSLILGSTNGINGATADTKVGIGTTAPVSHLNVVSTSTTSPRGVANEQYNNGMDGVQFRGRKARGTPATPAAIQSGDVLGNYVFDGYDGSAFGTGVQIRPVAEESWSPTAHGAYLALWTTPPGSTTNTEKMRITGSGNVGIGTATPTEKLQVNGNIRLSGTILTGAPEEPVPDYVFESDYKLMPIEELQSYIQKQKHLPNLPNATQIEEKGLNLGEFQMKLLEKIEELTLYTVQLAKTNQEQATELRRKDADIAALSTRLAALELMMERIAKQVR